ncbi:MAG: DUF454 family protein [Chitinivibrionales bacterium]|nr:DUF454 family protein [Chitinivibrionales bacterium]
MHKNVFKVLLITLGTVCVVLGAAGIFLPLLPTTPFLLLAAACYARSSQQFYRWLTTNKYFGEYIRNFREHKAIPLRAKIFSVSLIWVTIGFSIVWIVPLFVVKVLLLAVAVAVTLLILSYETLRP